MECRCICGSKFSSRKAKIRHKKAGTCPEQNNKMQFKDLPKHISKDTRMELLDTIGEDFSDGAYFVLAEELGVEF